MPELPEVEILRRQVAPAIADADVVSAWACGHPRFDDALLLEGRRIESVSRRGKYLLLALDDGREAIVHLGMTGQVSVGAPGSADPKHLRARLLLDGPAGRVELRLADARKFGRFVVVAAGQYAALPTLDRLGPEPLGPGFTPTGLHRALRTRHTPVKAVLLEQRAVAGIGNWIADEVLHAAGIAPQRHAADVDAASAQRLHDAIRHVIARALEAGGTSFSDYVHADGTSTGSNVDNLQCYGRAGLPCTTCGTALAKDRVAGRGTTFCSTCQR